MKSAQLDTTRSQDERHRDKRQKKQERISGLEALLSMWEEKGGNHHDYILDLRRKLRNAQNQLNAMKI